MGVLIPVSYFPSSVRLPAQSVLPALAAFLQIHSAGCLHLHAVCAAVSQTRLELAVMVFLLNLPL